MGISLAPDAEKPVDPTADATDPLKKKPAIGLAASAPLPTEYANEPSTTGQPQNRLKLATEAFDTFAKSTAPQYTADLRQASQVAAGKGQIGSGGLRTTYGNLANQRALALDTQKSSLINAATAATIADQQAGRGLDISQQNADTSRIGTTGNLALQKSGQEQSGQQFDKNLALQQKAQELDAAYKAGTLTLAQKDQALRELSNSQQNTIATGQLQLAKDQLAQTASQFGLSLAQSKELATIADKTANRQIDVSSAQGQNGLLLELARIMGSKDLAGINPAFLASIAKALGITLPTAPTAPPPTPPVYGGGEIDPETGQPRKTTGTEIIP